MKFQQLAAGNRNDGEHASIRTFGLSLDGGATFADYCARVDGAQGVNMLQAVSDTDAHVCATQVKATCGVLGF